MRLLGLAVFSLCMVILSPSMRRTRPARVLRSGWSNTD